MKKNMFIDINKRIFIIKYIFIILFIIILVRIFYLNIFNGSYYKMLLNNKNNSIIYGESVPRGRIYDRNMKLLVDNVAVKSIYYKKSSSISKKEEIELAYKVSDVIDLDYKKVLLVNLKEFYYALYPDKVNNKISDDEYQLLKNRKLSNSDIEKLKFDRITLDDLDIFDERDRRAAYLYYLMNKGYFYDEKIIKSDNVSDYEYAFISEHVNSLKGFNTRLEWDRVYLYNDTLRGILGKVSSRDSGVPFELKDYYLQLGYSLNDRVGVSGLEKQYESVLKGEKAKYRLNDNKLVLVSPGKKGNDIVLSIDIDLQLAIDKMLKEEVIKTKKEPNTEFYNHTFVVIQNPLSGEIYAMAGKELYKDNNKYKVYDFSEGSIISTATPGSVVKGASIIVGYNEKVIDIGTIMKDECIKLNNLPRKCSWRTLGYINDLNAIKYSSNVYQFKIAMMVGGFDYKYNKNLIVDLNAFNKYRDIFYQFGLGSKTGIDFPIEEDGYKGGSYAGDLLLNFAIGQYDTYTPLQLSQYISTIANDGKRMKPHFLNRVLDNNKNDLYVFKPVMINKVSTLDKYIKRVQQGMRMVVKDGTGYGYMDNKHYPVGKTGTSESYVDINGDGVVDYESISNNFVGYAPMDKPVMSITVVSPDVQNPNRGDYRSNVSRRVSKRGTDIFFSFYDKNGKKIK